MAALLSATAFAGTLYGKIITAPLICDYMVLQRDMKVPVWGKAEPGEKITVEFAGQKVETVTGVKDKNLVTCTIPDGVTVIGKNAFKDCTKLQKSLCRKALRQSKVMLSPIAVRFRNLKSRPGSKSSTNGRFLPAV